MLEGYKHEEARDESCAGLSLGRRRPRSTGNLPIQSGVMFLMRSLAFNDTSAGALPPVGDVGRANQDQIQSPTSSVLTGISSPYHPSVLAYHAGW